MARISIRTKSGQPWQFLESTPYSDEAVLRDLIFDEPALIPAADIGVASDMPAVAIREMGLPGAGSSDIILVYADGTIAVVECKLATNPERKREVIDYASSLTELTYDEFDERVRVRREESLLELMAKAALSREWDADRFPEQIASTLTGGSFRLVIAIDVMDENLARLVRYISTQSRGALRVFGLEMRYHRQEDLEAIVPHIANPVTSTTDAAPREEKRWGSDEFREELTRQPDPRVRAALEDMLEFALGHAAHMYWGRSKDYGTFGFGVTRPDGRTLSLFTCYTTDAFYVNMGTLRQHAPQLPLDEFVSTIGKLTAMERVAGELAYPQFQTRDTLADESARELFKRAVVRLQNAMAARA